MQVGSLDSMRPQRGWSARCFFISLGREFVLGLCELVLLSCVLVVKSSWQPSLFHSKPESFPRAGTTPTVERMCVQCRSSERSLVQFGTRFIGIQMFAFSTRKPPAA